MRIFCIGDIVGEPGINILSEKLEYFKKDEHINLIIANAENSCHGRGITRSVYDRLSDMGIDGFTMGNHVWNCKDIFPLMQYRENIIRPANFENGCPGRGSMILNCNGVLVGEMARDYINENLDGKAKIVVLTLYQPHTMAREEGFRSVIDQMDGVEVISTQDSQGNRETAANIIAGIKEDYDIIFSVVPNGWLGAIAQLEAMQVPTDEVKVFGPISSEEAYDLLRDQAAGEEGYLVGGWSFDARIIATATLEAAGKHFLGESQEQIQKCQSLSLTKENINEYYPAG